MLRMEPCLMVEIPQGARQVGRSEAGQWLFLETGLRRRKLWRSCEGLSFPGSSVSCWHFPGQPSCVLDGNKTSKETVLTLELSMRAAMSRWWWIWELRVYEMLRVLPQTERNVHLLIAMVMMVPYSRRLLLRIQHNNRHAWPRECLPLYICLGNGATHTVL